MEPLGAGDPERIGEYRLLGRLGAGGMGRVYLGRTAGGRTVAVKAVRGELADDPEFRARFRQEVAAARRVGGRWTAPVLDADTEGEHPWVATGYVAGPALGAAVRRYGPLPAPTVHALGAGLTEALEQVHALGLVHRDVKPSNVLLALDGPRLIDFGVARALDAATALTQSGFVVGSPGFMSPEQAAGEPVGPAGDVFSLGALLGYAATGVAPFGEGISAAVLLYRVLHEEPELAGLDGELRAVVEECLAKDPARRPSPARVRERLAAGAAELGDGGWLPPVLAAAVGRSAVELLDLEAGPLRDRPVTDTPWSPTYVEREERAAGGAGPDATGSAPAAPPAGRRRGRAVAAAVGAVVLLGLLVAELAVDGLPWDRRAGSQDTATTGVSGPPARSGGPDGTGSSPMPSRGDGQGQTPGQTPGQSATGVAAGGPGTLPTAFVGTWKGIIHTRTVPLPSTFTVEFKGGRVGEVVGHTSNASSFSSTVCRGVLTLLSADAEQVVLQERADPQNSGGCTGAPERQTYTVAGSGTIHLQVSDEPMGMDPSGDLTRQS